MLVALEGLPPASAAATDSVHRINGRIRALVEERFDVVSAARADVVVAGGLFDRPLSGAPRCIVPHGALGDPGHWMTSVRHLRRKDMLAVSSTSDLRIVDNMAGPTGPAGDGGESSAGFCRAERLPLFVDTDVFAPLGDDRAALRREFSLPPTAPLLLVAARPIAEKNLHGAVELCAAVRERGPAAVLVVAGGLPDPATEYGGYIADLVGRRNVPVHDAGVVPPAGLNRLCNACDALVHLTLVRKENFGLVAVEAQAAGLPVLCGHWGGCQDTVEAGVTGYYGPTFLTGGQRRVDWRSLVEPCAALLQDEERRRAMGEAGRARVEALYSQAVFARRLVDLIAVAAEGAERGDEPVALSEWGQQTVVTYAMVARDQPALTDSAQVSRQLYREQYGTFAYRPIHRAMATLSAPPQPADGDFVYRNLDVDAERGVVDPIWRALVDLAPDERRVVDALATPRPFASWARDAGGPDRARTLVERGVVARLGRAMGW